MPPKKAPLKKVLQKILSESERSMVRESAYLGRRGYVVKKSALSPEEMANLREELYVRAAPGIQGEEVVAFPVYRENDNKFYLPRFYGNERYGIPNKSEIPCGTDIELRFTGSLRDYQTHIIQVYLNHVRGRGEDKDGDRGEDGYNGGGGILEVPCGRGKTVMALNIVSQIKKKTLILVHKEFLMNQWIERIGEFLPSARVGKIQGNKCEIDGNEIVIGMIQTMFSRDFPDKTFDSFGLTIIDEVHRIGSEEFSKTLLKVSTTYMLGISATVDRKDGLTKVLHYFIGPKIYTEEGRKEDAVIVRGIYYSHKDAEFEKTEYDFRGNPKYSTMISKLCDFGPRKDFLVRILRDLRAEHPEGQIMVLAHNRSLLTYLYDAILHHKIGTTGYYVGGMKEAALKETESKNIVLATYAMAAEALDIKTLSILLMATPKTDIEQSVGRILRSKHANPIVVDVIDMHDLFQNQWRTRKRFYKKCFYKVVSVKSADYSANAEWKSEHDPTNTVKKEKKGGCLIDL